MKSIPKISVVTPSYNQGEFLEQTIQSVLSQNYPNLEYIIIDGGSTDNSVEIIKGYEDHLHYWVSESDNGMYEAINKGLSFATGDILAYLNSDDLYLPWTLGMVASFFHEHPEVDLIYGDLLNVQDRSRWAELFFYPPFWLSYIQRSGFLGQPAVFWRRRVHEDLGGFDTSLKLVADCDYWIKAGERWRIEKVNEILAIARDHRDAQRFAKAEQFNAELSLLRKRHQKLERRITLYNVLDKAWSAMWNRWYLMKFTSLYLTRKSTTKLSSKQIDWNLSMNSINRISMLHVLGSVMPFVKGRWARWASIDTKYFSPQNTQTDNRNRS